MAFLFGAAEPALPPAAARGPRWLVLGGLGRQIRYLLRRLPSLLGVIGLTVGGVAGMAVAERRRRRRLASALAVCPHLGGPGDGRRNGLRRNRHDRGKALDGRNCGVRRCCGHGLGLA